MQRSRRRKIPTEFDPKQVLIATKACPAEGQTLEPGVALPEDISMHGRIRLWCMGFAEYESDYAGSAPVAAGGTGSSAGKGDAAEGSAATKASEAAAKVKPKAPAKKKKKGFFGLGKSKKTSK